MGKYFCWRHLNIRRATCRRYFKCAGKGAVILVTDLVSDFRDRTVLCTDQGFCVLHFLGQDIVTEVHTRVILKIYGKVRFTQPDKCCDILRLDIAVKM